MDLLADTTVVGEAATIEHNLFDTGSLGPLGDELTHAAGGSNAAARAVGPLGGLVGGGGRQGATGLVIDDLQHDVLVGTEHCEARAHCGAVDLLADATVTADPGVAANFCVITHS